MNTSGNTVLITGGGSGIGFALTEAFSAEQNTVIIVGRNAERLEAARAKLPTLHTLQADITSEPDRQRLVATLLDRFPRLNILVNNAAAAFFSNVQTDQAAYDKARLEIETNYLAPLRLIQLLLGQLQQHPSAAIINMTTVGVYLPMAVMPGYSASKAALHSYTQSLRRQLAGSTVKVFEVLAPAVDTELVSTFQMKKMAPDKLAAKVLEGLCDDRLEMAIGSAGVLRWLARLLPRTAERKAYEQVAKALEHSTPRTAN